MLQFHTLVLLLDTQVYFGHTAVSHDGAAGSLNTLVLTAVSHDGAAVLFCMLTHWHRSQDTLVVQLYSLDMLVQLFLGYAGTVVLCTLVYFDALA